MRRSIATGLAAAGFGLAAWCGPAFAQGVDVYVGPSGTYGYAGDPYYSQYRSGPRVYGYYYEDNGRHLRRPESYRTGSERWWRGMDREGRGGFKN